MKRIVCLCVILLCSISFAFAQGGRGRTTKKKPVVKKKIDPQIAEAEKAWVPFWKNLTTAVKNRDKNSFKEMISRDYGGNCNESIDVKICNCHDYPDKRDAYFCWIAHKAEWFDTPSYSWWDDIGNLIFKKGLKIYKISKYEELISRVISYGRDNGRSASFTFEKDGKWYFESIGSFGE